MPDVVVAPETFLTIWHWVGFIGVILTFLALDLGVFHRKGHVVSVKEAIAWTALWFTLAMAFAWGMGSWFNEEWAKEFVAGYIIELSLSMDNVFVIALIFAYFKVPAQYQHRVLFWGIMGALVMRGVMIGAGAALVSQYMWVLYIFGGFLLFTGIKMLFTHDEGVEPEKNPMVKLARKFFPVSPSFEGDKFFTTLNGARAITPLALVLVMVETTDLIFAVDSIPAIFAITQKPFVVFTSNVFAILGLRSLYFALAGAIAYFRFLKYGLALVLVFVGVKMLIDPHTHTPQWYQSKLSTGLSLGIVISILATAVMTSVLSARLEAKKRVDPQ